MSTNLFRNSFFVEFLVSCLARDNFFCNLKKTVKGNENGKFSRNFFIFWIIYFTFTSQSKQSVERWKLLKIWFDSLMTGSISENSLFAGKTSFRLREYESKIERLPFYCCPKHNLSLKTLCTAWIGSKRTTLKNNWKFSLLLILKIFIEEFFDYFVIKIYI